MKKTIFSKELWISCMFLAFLFGGLLLHILTPDVQVSYSERRALRLFPAISWNAVKEGTWMDALEGYLLDQFPARETLRGVKATLSFSLFRQSDNRGIYIQDEHIFKMDYILDEASVIRFAEKVNALYATHMRESNVYVAIIPDKSQYLVPQTHFTMPYARMETLVKLRLGDGITYIPLRESLTLDSYYMTDIHWRQEKLQPVTAQLGAYMGFEADAEEMRMYAYTPFYGGYYGQAARFGIKPDTLYYLRNGMIDNAEVRDMQNPDLHAVYNIAALGGIDSYDVFLNGATPLLTIQNPSVQNGRKLLIFRDSYASSIAPLLCTAYEEITLIDLRYISSSLLEQNIDFTAQDVLFLYGEQMLNTSTLLK